MKTLIPSCTCSTKAVHYSLSNVPTAGTINKLYMFDKGCTFLIIFGMPGKKHEDEPTRALKAADNIMKDFHANKLQASIGEQSCYLTIVIRYSNNGL